MQASHPVQPCFAASCRRERGSRSRVWCVRRRELQNVSGPVVLSLLHLALPASYDQHCAEYNGHLSLNIRSHKDIVTVSSRVSVVNWEASGGHSYLHFFCLTPHRLSHPHSFFDSVRVHFPERPRKGTFCSVSKNVHTMNAT